MMTDLARVVDALEHYGLLLLSDARLPSVVSLISEQPVRGSWWGSPQGGRIYKVSVALDDHPDITAVKLIAGKVTFVHRRLWPALVTLGSAREPWQLDGLSATAGQLLDAVEAEDEVRTDDLPFLLKPADAVRELEQRLLVHADEIHTERGAHAKVLRSWVAWAALAGVHRDRSTADARACLERAVAAWDRGARLPWQPAARRRSARVRAAS